MELFAQLEVWHWVVVAAALFLLEMLIVTGFLLGIALAAVVMAVLVLLLPIFAWDWQVLLFGVLAVAITLGYRRYFKRVNEASENPLLNDRASQMIGRVFTLSADLEGTGADMLGDTRWMLRCAGRIPKGTRVRVAAVDGMVLAVEEVP
jgi:membrane protein implicated in regulation of membrane protease activity